MLFLLGLVSPPSQLQIASVCLSLVFVWRNSYFISRSDFHLVFKLVPSRGNFADTDNEVCRSSLYIVSREGGELRKKLLTLNWFLPLKESFHGIMSLVRFLASKISKKFDMANSNFVWLHSLQFSQIFFFVVVSCSQRWNELLFLVRFLTSKDNKQFISHIYLWSGCAYDND